MKNKKGFTLIELLAVIVVLAIIALIAVPMILGVVERARKSAAESSAYGYIDAVEKQMAINLVNDISIPEGAVTVPTLKSTYNVKVKGEEPKSGWVKIEKGKTVDYSLEIGKYVVDYNNGKAKATKNGTVRDQDTIVVDTETEQAPTYTIYTNGQAIYYNPVTNEKCSESEATQNYTTNGVTGTKTGCMKWYTFNDEGENASKVNMILDHNTTATQAWYSSATNVSYENSLVKPVVDKLTSESGWDNSLNTRLITAEEIKVITGNKTIDLSNASSWFYCFESNKQDYSSEPYCNQITNNKYYWLFDYTNNCTTYGCNVSDSSNSGYWTSTTAGSAETGASVWLVYCDAGLFDDHASFNFYGIRPVITVSKDVIK